MKTATAAELQPYLARLKALPFIRALRVENDPRPEGTAPAIAMLRLQTPAGARLLRAEIKRTNLTLPVVDGFLARGRKRSGAPWILLAPFIGPRIGRRLRDHHANYLDLAGNCHLALGPNYLAQTEGKRPDRPAPADRGVRGPGYQVLFVILARPGLLDAPVRAIAAAAGIGKTAAADMIVRLTEEGLVGTGLNGRRLLQRQIVLDRWLAGYTTVVRPRLLIGRYRTDDSDPIALERKIENTLRRDMTWGWGGGAAAMRLTHHFRGTDTVLHLAAPISDLPRRLRALPARDGPLIVIRTPGPIALEGVEAGTVHPLLVYTELLATGQSRALEAAATIWDRYLARGDR